MQLMVTPYQGASQAVFATQRCASAISCRPEALQSVQLCTYFMHFTLHRCNPEIWHSCFAGGAIMPSMPLIDRSLHTTALHA
jgi:hypothetical protein